MTLFSQRMAELSSLDWEALAVQVCQLLEQASDQFILTRWQKLTEQEIHTKSSASDFVTIADLEAEAWLTPRLAGLLAGAQVVAEEASTADPALRDRAGDGLVWTLDPVDGTRNFVQQRPAFCSMVALAENGVGKAAWIWLPLERACLHASPDGLFWLTGQKAEKLANATHQRGLDRMQGTGGVLGLEGAQRAAVQERLKALAGRRFVGSAGIEAVRLALGELDFLYHARCNPWDHLPLDIICRQAGMWVRQLPGGAIYHPSTRNGILVAPDAAEWQGLASHIWPEATE
jgi:fructose-1,6-bisphosphatase/inositol monophosphatase family enzyme